MKIFSYKKTPTEDMSILCTNIESNFPIKIANIGNDNPTTINGYVEQDNVSTRICLYENQDIISNTTPQMSVYSSDISTDLDNFMINRGYSKI